MNTSRLRLGVLASGGGSNLQAIIDAIEAGRLNALISVVISDKADALALKRAEKHGIEAVFLGKDRFPNREAYDGELARILKEKNVELVVLAGFMRVVTKVLIDAFPLKVMNIHPSLLPSFPGLHVQKKAIDYGARFSGCTVHFVDEGVDTGPIIIQAVVPVLEGDTEEILAARILKEEHRIYPYAIKLYSEGRIEVSGRRVKIRDYTTREGTLVNPQVL